MERVMVFYCPSCGWEEDPDDAECWDGYYCPECGEEIDPEIDKREIIA